MSKLGRKLKQAFMPAIFGLFGSRGKKKATTKPTELALPDEEELKRAARRRQSMLAQRSGRASTILDDDTLG